MPLWSKISLFVVLTMAPVLAVVIYGMISESTKTEEQVGYAEVYWNRLRELNYKTGDMSEDLERLNGGQVAIPGFVVPLDDDAEGLAEFILVPNPKACVHVPPPPPNQMVMVRMQSGSAPKREWGPVWVKGTFRIQESKSGFGKISFLLLGDVAEKYKPTQG